MAPLSGNYTIPTGVTLLVPFDDADTLYTTEPEASDLLLVRLHIER